MSTKQKWAVCLIALCAAVGLLAGCARSPEEKEARFLKRGQVLAAKKDYSRALLEFQNAVRATPVVMSDSPNSWDFGPSFGMIHTLSKAQNSTY